MTRAIPVPKLFALLCLLSVSPLLAADINSGNDPGHFVLFNSDPGAGGQTASSTPSQTNQSPGSLPRASSVQPSPLSVREKWVYYLKSTYGPKSFAYTAAGAGIKQAEGSVPEWGGGMEGYGKRYASSFGQKAINRTVRIGLQTLLHEDPRYIASDRTGIWSRTLYAASQAAWVRKDGGGTRIAYSRFIGDFSAAYLSRQWHPDSYHTTSDYITAGLTSLGIDAAKNVFNEFWPDVRRMLHH